MKSLTITITYSVLSKGKSVFNSTTLTSSQLLLQTRTINHGGRLPISAEMYTLRYGVSLELYTELTQCSKKARTSLENLASQPSPPEVEQAQLASERATCQEESLDPCPSVEATVLISIEAYKSGKADENTFADETQEKVTGGAFQ